MSTTLTGPEPADQPDPDQAATSAPAPQRFAGLLRRVIDYGKHLIVAVRLRAACPEFPRLAKPFGTADLHRILARISTAIGRALLLEDGFHRQGGLGRYAFAPPLRNPSPRKPRAARPDAALDRDRDRNPAPAQPAQPARRTGNPLVPTARQLATQLCRHPVGVVLAGICRDLGITPHHPLWDEVSRCIVACGGSLAELEQDADTRWCSKRWLEIPVARPPSIPACLWPKWWPQPESPTAAATGPPGVC
jgi:hypothetical protein